MNAWMKQIHEQIQLTDYASRSLGNAGKKKGKKTNSRTNQSSVVKRVKERGLFWSAQEEENDRREEPDTKTSNSFIPPLQT